MEENGENGGRWGRTRGLALREELADGEGGLVGVPVEHLELLGVVGDPALDVVEHAALGESGRGEVRAESSEGETVRLKLHNGKLINFLDLY